MKRILIALALLINLICFSQTEVTFYTNHGDFTVELHDSIMPITTTNFIGLVNNKGYDGKEFYRVIANFVIQGGFRTGLPPAIQDEFDSTGVLSNRRWTLSMANSGPNTGSSEIFINLKDNLFLDYDKAPLTSAHPVFGTVKNGYSEILSIAGVAVDGNDEPIVPVTMDSVRVTSSGLSTLQIDQMKHQSAVYPNPVTSESVLNLYCHAADLAQIKLIDVSGKVIYQTSKRVEPGKNIIFMTELGLEFMDSGIFQLQVNCNMDHQTFKVRYH